MLIGIKHKERYEDMKKKSLKLFAGLVTSLTLIFGMSLSSFANTAVVDVQSVRIRSEASTSGAVIEQGTKGTSYEIESEVTGSDGYAWYKIKTSSGSGYVRGDLVKVQQDAGEAVDNTANTATSNAATVSTAINPVPAKVAGTAAVNVRSGAGTGYSKVGALDGGTTITLVGEATDAAGNKWYEIKCDSKNITGFLRSDLISVDSSVEIAPLGEGAESEEGEFEGEGEYPSEEGEEGEEIVPEEPVEEHNDYVIVYTSDDSGEENYYLYDYTTGTRQKVNELLAGVDTLTKNNEKLRDQLTTYKILIIVLIGAAVLFLVLAIVFFVRSVTNREEEYYEDDFEEEEPKRVPKTRKARPEEEENNERESRPSRREPARNSGNAKAERDIVLNKQDAPAEKKRPRKAQNFLADDDEFEFEFLNMDDKD